MAKWKCHLYLLVIAFLAFFYLPNFSGATSVPTSVFIVPFEKEATTTFSAILGGNYTFTNASNTTAADFTVPTNVYASDLQLRVTAYRNSIYEQYRPPPAGKEFAGSVYNFSFFDVAFQTPVSTLSQPVSIVIHYSDSDISGLNAATLAAYRREGGDYTWALVPGSIVDTVNKTVSFETASFSSFALLTVTALPNSSPSPTPPFSSGSVGAGGPPSVSSTTRPTHTFTPLPILQMTDLNDDGRIDIVDLSILLYHYRETGDKARQYDFNRNGTVDFPDISIMMYYWTE